MPREDQAAQYFLAGLQQLMREKNLAVISPMIPDLTLQAVEDLVEIGAKVRGAYLRQYFLMAEKAKTEIPSAEELKKLRGMRELYDEMSTAFQALENAVSRGYVKTRQD